MVIVNAATVTAIRSLRISFFLPVSRLRQRSAAVAAIRFPPRIGITIAAGARHSICDGARKERVVDRIRPDSRERLAAGPQESIK